MTSVRWTQKIHFSANHLHFVETYGVILLIIEVDTSFYGLRKLFFYGFLKFIFGIRKILFIGTKNSTFLWWRLILSKYWVFYSKLFSVSLLFHCQKSNNSHLILKRRILIRLTIIPLFFLGYGKLLF